MRRKLLRFLSRLPPYLAVVFLVIVAALFLAGRKEIGLVMKDVPGGSAAEGARAIVKYGCGACHSIPGIPGADTYVGPLLTAYSRRHYIAGSLPNTHENLIRWLQNPQAIEPGTAMPNLGLTEVEARDIAAYLYTLR
jgi:cytochrome c